MPSSIASDKNNLKFYLTAFI